VAVVGEIVIAVVSNFNRLLLAFFVLLLVGCRPPVVDPQDPIPPPIPIPIVDTNEVTGNWFGQFRSNENFFVRVSATLVEESGVVTGTVTFIDEPVPTVGSVTGSVASSSNITRQSDLVLVVTDGSETITVFMVGVFGEGTFTGTFSGLLDSTGAITLVRVE
jgi:hypothetical protein